MTVSSGIAMDIHYCMGQKAGVDFYKTENEKCSKCGMTEKENGCCHDEHQFHKLADFHKNVFNELNFEAGAFTFRTEFPVYNWQVGTCNVNAYILNNTPPEYSGISSCILNCVFRI